MEMLSEDDLNLKDMTREELDRAWDLWFTLAQATNDFDPPYTHGVFVLCDLEREPPRPPTAQATPGDQETEKRQGTARGPQAVPPRR
jgi:hypothetical protein